MYFFGKHNLLGFHKYYLIKDNNAYKIKIGKTKDKIIIKSINYEIILDNNILSKLFFSKFNNINESYEYIINLFDLTKVFIKEIIINNAMKLLFYLDNTNKEKKIEIILNYNKENKEIVQNLLKDFNELNKYINNLKEEVKILKQEVKELKMINNNSNIISYEISKEININMNSTKNENFNPLYIQSSKSLTSDSYAHYALDNTFSIFKSINNILYIIYSTKNKSIISYNLITNQKISEIKNAHNDYITNFRHYLDEIKKVDLIMSISSIDNNIKVWDINKWNLLCDIKNINNKGSLHSACFLNLKIENNYINYIITCNDNYYNSELIKIFDFNGNKIKEINNSNDRTFFIDCYYDNIKGKYYIITGNNSYIKSYDFNENKIYHKYCDKNDGEDGDKEDHDSIIIINEEITKILESSEDGNIRIWNFHSGILLKKISISQSKLYGICLWNNNYLIVSCDDKTLKIIDFKREIIINNLMGNETIINIKTIIHPKYGKCLITQDWRNQIKLWINKA